MIFNLAFVPTIYFSYPETASRTPEDLNAYFGDDPSLLAFRDKDAVSSRRRQKYVESEEDNIKRAKSVDAMTFRRGSRVASGRGMGWVSAMSRSTLGGAEHEENQEKRQGMYAEVDRV